MMVCRLGDLFACATDDLAQTASGLRPEPTNAALFSPPAAGPRLKGKALTLPTLWRIKQHFFRLKDSCAGINREPIRHKIGRRSDC